MHFKENGVIAGVLPCQGGVINKVIPSTCGYFQKRFVIRDLAGMEELMRGLACNLHDEAGTLTAVCLYSAWKDAAGNGEALASAVGLGGQLDP